MILQETGASRYATSSIVTQTISLLIDKACLDKNGAFWPLSSSYSHGDQNRYECSLGFGNVGVLFTLIEYYRATRDSTVFELIQKSAEWIGSKMERTRIVHGFYTGTGGQWHLSRELESICPGHPFWSKNSICDLLWQSPERDLPGSMYFGVAGTIIGAFGALESTDIIEEQTPLEALAERLVAAARLAEQGLFWDFMPTSLRPSTGFLVGNAGVDYCLAHIASRLGKSYTPLVRGSLAYADYIWELEGNEPYQDDEITFFKRLNTESAGASLKRLSPNHQADKIRTPGWSCGSAGVLLSRACLFSLCQEEDIKQKAGADIIRTTQALSTYLDSPVAHLDYSLHSGLAGIVLSIDAAKRRAPEFAQQLEDVYHRAKTKLEALTTPLTGNDFSLLTGSSGPVYALLSIGNGKSSCIDPIADITKNSGRTDRCEPGRLTPFLSRRLPNAQHILMLSGAINDRVSLANVRDCVAQDSLTDPQSAKTKLCRFEVELHSKLATLNFRKELLREIGTREQAKIFAKATVQQLLSQHFVLSENITLLTIDFNPASTNPAQETSKSHYIVRASSSSGITDSVLSQLQYSLLNEFSQSRETFDVISAIVNLIDAKTITPRQLALHCLHQIRSFAVGGFITAENTPVKSRIFQHFKKRKSRHLFPDTG